MNIRIPYTHIGNLNEILHVSVIAVRNNKAIYTRDISKQEMMVLNHNAQEFIVIDDEIYNSCSWQGFTIRRFNSRQTKNNEYLPRENTF